MSDYLLSVLDVFDMRRLPTGDFLTKESSLVDEYTLNVDFKNGVATKDGNY
ncbi:hypothetical protein [Peribacillus butanolivorans]|uniref:hypothetical protein n=1 Tax=Peribacillus butanolivorans TaxID=421767 RepID=UPI00381B1AA1